MNSLSFFLAIVPGERLLSILLEEETAEGREQEGLTIRGGGMTKHELGLPYSFTQGHL